MQTANHHQEILRLALPNIISNISVPLLSTVDTGLMGHLSAQHLGAVGLGAMIFNFLYWNLGFLRMGTTGMTAQAFGENNAQAQLHTLGRALFLACLLSAGLILFQQPLAQLGYELLQAPSNQIALIQEYFSIRILAAPAALGLVVFMGFFFGMQNPFYPLLLTIIINICNMLASYLLVVEYEWGIAGVAYGTLIAQYIGLLVAIGIFLKQYRHLLPHYVRAHFWRLAEFGNFLHVNSNIFLRTFALSLAFGFFYRQSAVEGALILAVNTILMQFLSWMSFGIDGFAYAAESLVGKYKGAKQQDALLKTIRLSFVWGMGLALGFSLIYGFAGSALIGFFTDEIAVEQAALPYLWWIVVLPIIGSPCYIWDGIFIGLTAVKTMRNSMILAFAAYALTYYLGAPYLDATHSLWLAMMLFLAVRGLLQWYWFRKDGLELS